MLIALESCGLHTVADYHYLADKYCEGCGEQFVSSDVVEPFVDRMNHRAYSVHNCTTCYEQLVAKLKKRSVL